MDQVDDLHRFRGHPVDDDVVRMHHGLARSRDAARAVHIGPLGEPFGAEVDRGLEPLGRREVSFRNIGEDGPRFLPGAFAPDQRQHGFFRLALAMISRISAIT